MKTKKQKHIEKKEFTDQEYEVDKYSGGNVEESVLTHEESGQAGDPYYS